MITDFMASTAPTRNSFQCDYLHSHTLPFPNAFTSEQAELAHINEQIRSLDDHISQLNVLRRGLHNRSCQLHNLLAPIHALPIEILSHIFKQVADPGEYMYPVFKQFRRCLRRALILSSLSAYLRRVAFCTPELWNHVPLHITDGEAIGRVSSLLQHCIARTVNINISVLDTLQESEECYSAIEILLTSDVTRKIKLFELYHSADAPYLWIEKLKGPSFPIVDTLSIQCASNNRNLDLRTLNTVTRLRIYEPSQEHPINMPPSVRYLFIEGVRQQVLVRILYQCPNLEECITNNGRRFDSFGGDPHFNEPLTLTHLKHLSLDIFSITMTPSSAQNLRLPSLEYLRFRGYKSNEFVRSLLLCRNVSTTLTTLKISVFDEALGYDDLYQLCGLPLPNLRELGFEFRCLGPILSAVRALTQRAEECGIATQPRYLPSLTALILRCDFEMKPRCLLGLLEKWRVGEGSYFHLDVKGYFGRINDLPEEVREELSSIVGSRQIEITWGD